MTTDEKIEIAEALARELIDVTRTDWNKWIEYFETKRDLHKAFSFLQMLSGSKMLRPGPRKANERIFKVLSKQKAKLSKLAKTELSEIFGYISWILTYRPAGFGMWKDRG